MADCTQAGDLIKGIAAQVLIADKGYDTDAIVRQTQAAGMEVVIPPKSNRRHPREYDEYLYKLRHLVEKRFSTTQALEGDCHPLCKAFIFLPRCRSIPLRHSVGLYLMTTLSRPCLKTLNSCHI